MNRSILTLPEDVLAVICEKLPAIEDVLSFQTAHYLLHHRINRVFWGQPKGLIFADDADNTKLELNEGVEMAIRKPCPVKMEVIGQKARNLRRLYLNRGSQLGHGTDDLAVKTLLSTLANNEASRLQKIVAIYHKPERNVYRDKSVWPSRNVHSELCKLIRVTSSLSLSFVGVGVHGTDGFVSFSRQTPNAKSIAIKYHHQPSWDARLNVFYPLLNAFASATPPTDMSIEMKMTPSFAHLILDHCIQSCAPINAPNILQNINIMFTMLKETSNAAKILFENFHNARQLKMLVWSFGPEFPEDLIAEMCYPRGGCAYDIFVNTPTLKKTFVGTQKTAELPATKALKCVS